MPVILKHLLDLTEIKNVCVKSKDMTTITKERKVPTDK